jgi:AraC-like DNA-binding protein
MCEVKMLSKYDIAKLEGALYDFNKATGVSITLYDHERNAVTSMGTACSEYCAYIAKIKEMKHSCTRSNNELIDKCKQSKQITRHICRAGLLDIAIPLIHFGEIVGYLMIGQIKQIEEFPKDLLSLESHREILFEKYENLTLFDEEKINSIINIGTMLTKYIMLENMVRTNPSKSSAMIENYICDHLSERISVSTLAAKTHMSASGIYKCIRQSHNCTLSEFILAKRVEKAMSLLENSDMPLAQIAEELGFSDAAHFSKSFKKINSISPIKYRKNSQNCDV